MTYDIRLTQFEDFLEQEFKKEGPLVVLPNGNALFKRYAVKKNKQGDWNLVSVSGQYIDTFKLKASAILAAKFYDNIKLQKYNEVKMMDSKYWNSVMDTNIFRERYQQTTDMHKKDIYLSRFELCKQRSELYKEQIATMFMSAF